MHAPLLAALAVAFGALAIATIPSIATLIPPPARGPFVALVGPVRASAERWLKAPALGFLAASAIFAVAALALQGWLHEALGVNVSLGNVRWVLMLPQVGAWAVVLAWCVGGAAFVLGTWRGFARWAHVPAFAVFGLATFVAWFAW